MLKKARNVPDLDDLAPSRAIRRLLKPIPPRSNRIVSSTGWLGSPYPPTGACLKSEVRASETTARKIDWLARTGMLHARAGGFAHKVPLREGFCAKYRLFVQPRRST